MRIWSLVCVFGFGVGLGVGGGVGCGSRPAPARVAGDAHAPVASTAPARLCPVPPPGTPELFLPAAELAHDLKLDVDRPGGVEPEDWKGKMTIDGVVTDAMWPLHAPQVHRLPDGRSVLDDRYNANQLYLWDPKTRTLTDLGRGMLMPVPGNRSLRDIPENTGSAMPPVEQRGVLVYTGDQATGIYSDIDPAAPRLRELHRFQRAEHDVSVAGVIDEMPALMIHDALQAPPDGDPRSVTFLCLTGAGASAHFTVTIPGGLNAMGVDPYDGHKLLLVGAVDLRKLYESGRGQPFDAEVGVLELASGTHRIIGRAAGGWSSSTAVEHPYLDVRWRGGIAANPPWFGTEVVTFVDPKTEQLDGTTP